MSAETIKKNILWVKGLLNGILAWALGFAVYMIPAFVVSLKMGFELGPKLKDPAAVSEQISQTIQAMYQNGLWLSIGFVIVTALLIFWRARKVAGQSGGKTVVNGLLVTVFPILFSILFGVSTGFGWTSLVEIILFLGAGYAGGHVEN